MSPFNRSCTTDLLSACPVFATFVSFSGWIISRPWNLSYRGVHWQCTTRKFGCGLLFAFHSCIVYHFRDESRVSGLFVSVHFRSRGTFVPWNFRSSIRSESDDKCIDSQHFGTCDSTPTSRSKGEKSKSRGEGILWRPPSRTACYIGLHDIVSAQVNSSERLPKYAHGHILLSCFPQLFK